MFSRLKKLFLLPLIVEVTVMDKLFEKIGDHFNNPEMSDRILVVKIRKDGWEKFEAARRVRSITKTNSQDGNDPIPVTNSNQQERPHISTQKESIVNATEQQCNTESAPSTTSDDSLNAPHITDFRTASSLSCDSGICDASFSETKKTVKSKKREESLIGGEKEDVVVNQDSGNLQDASALGDAVESRTSSDVDLDATFSKLLIADIRYAHKAGAIGLTSLNSGEEGAPATFPSQSTENGATGIKASEEDLTFADSVIREHQLYVHSFWLALNSSYFRGLFFSSGMKETKVKKV